jgi:hypothetical protein
MVTCDICGRSVSNIDVAIEQDWRPCYYADGEQQEGPVCFECSERFLRLADDGELEIIRNA